VRDGHILLVEDDPDDVELAMHALNQNRLANRVVHVRDGVEALDYLFATGSHAGRDPHDQPVVVLLDLKLPKLDGLDVLRRLRADERTRMLRVVILTSSREERDILAGYELGASSFVAKPVAFAAFVEAVRQLGVYWLLLNEPPPHDWRTRTPPT
jgi:two-component system response regulator